MKIFKYPIIGPYTPLLTPKTTCQYLSGPEILEVRNYLLQYTATPLLDESAAVDLTPSQPTYSVVSSYPNFNLVMSDMETWDRLLQSSLKEDNGGLYTHDYHPVQSVSTYYM